MKKNKYIEYIWYIVIIFAIWGSALGGINIPAIGLMSPYRITSILLLLLIIIRKIRTNMKIRKDIVITILIFLFCIVYNILILFFSNSQMIEGLKKGLNYFYGILFVILAKEMIKSKEDLYKTINIITINYIIILLLALNEAFTANRIFEIQISQTRRLNSMGTYLPIVAFYNTNGLATFLIMLLPIVCNNTIIKDVKKQKILKICIISVSALIIYLTESRLACIVLILYLIFLIACNLKSKKKIIYFLTGILAVFLICNSIFSEELKQIESNIFGNINQENASVATRSNIIRNGLESLEKSYFLGIGVGNFESYVAEYNDTFELSVSHNFIIELLVENGVIILAILLAIYLKMLFRILKKLRKEKKQENKKIFYDTLFLMLMFPLTTSINSTSYGFLPMWIMISIFSIIASPDIDVDELKEENLEWKNQELEIQ